MAKDIRFTTKMKGSSAEKVFLVDSLNRMKSFVSSTGYWPLRVTERYAEIRNTEIKYKKGIWQNAAVVVTRNSNHW